MMFFFKQKTAYEMRSSDWSSDVCSSDLSGIAERRRRAARRMGFHRLAHRPMQHQFGDLPVAGAGADVDDARPGDQPAAQPARQRKTDGDLSAAGHDAGPPAAAARPATGRRRDSSCYRSASPRSEEHTSEL